MTQENEEKVDQLNLKEEVVMEIDLGALSVTHTTILIYTVYPVFEINKMRHRGGGGGGGVIGQNTLKLRV